MSLAHQDVQSSSRMASGFHNTSQHWSNGSFSLLHFPSRILRLSLSLRKQKYCISYLFLHWGGMWKQLSLFPSVCQFWFLWEDKRISLKQLATNTDTDRTHCGLLHTLKEYDGHVLWWSSMLLLTSRCSHLCVISSLCMWLTSQQQITAKVMRLTCVITLINT